MYKANNCSKDCSKMNNLIEKYDKYYGEHIICTGSLGKINVKTENEINSK